MKRRHRRTRGTDDVTDLDADAPAETDATAGGAPGDGEPELDGAADAAVPAPGFDPAELYAWLDGEHADVRRRALGILTSERFARVDERATAAYREAVLDWCRELADAGLGALAYPEEFGGRHDVAGSIAVFETIGYHDLSLLVKYGVHFGLFGGSILLLGTRSHHERFLSQVASLQLPGCFAMTETAHGSNVRDIETTATWDAARGGFVVHTPRPEARKDYIGNAALHGRMAVVFAQLRTAGGEHGVHAFLVPIRDEAGAPLPGVAIEDCGLKIGLNGVDNGRIAFDHVCIPRQNLLDRYGSVSPGGVYRSPIRSATRRFFTMLGTLVAGRISIACAGVSVGKSALTIAIRYTAQRRQFGPDEGTEVPVLDYTTMQRTLLPRLASAYALHFATRALVRRFTERAGSDAQEIETLAAALKAWASEWTVDTVQACREACAGFGYLHQARLGTLRADSDAFTTFEGANPVLYQLVARGLLTEYREEFGELKAWTVARYLAGRAATRVTELNPIATRRTDADHLRDLSFHAAALRYREERLLASLARRLKRRLDEGMDAFHALNQCQDHAVQLGRAFAERFICEQAAAAVEGCPRSEHAAELRRLAALYGLSRLEAGAAWFLEAGYLEPAKSRAIRNQINELCSEIRPAAEALVASFGIPDALLDRPDEPTA